MKQISERRASSWLYVLPLKEQGFNLNKDEFYDAIALQNNRHISNLPFECPCGNKFYVNHAISFKKWGVFSTRLNNEANLTKKVCTDVQVEPKL